MPEQMTTGGNVKTRKLTPAQWATIVLLVLAIGRWLLGFETAVPEPEDGKASSPTISARESAAPDRIVTVKRVSDGDTFVSREDNKRVRLIGVNAPELEREDHEEEFYAKEATQWLRARIDGTKVTLRFGPDPEDQYGRILAWVYAEDGSLVNKEILEVGNARLLARFGLPADLEPELRAAEAAARARGLGIWQKKKR
ncbi:MAG: thermonuclease family protein [Planctomycetaceae bacterium]